MLIHYGGNLKHLIIISNSILDLIAIIMRLIVYLVSEVAACFLIR
jgi:hypothetical protein